MSINRCFVPTCVNTTRITPKKKFLKVPMDPKIRNKWYKAVGLTGQRVSKSGMLRCCEDHFDLQNDVENWIEYTMISTNLRLKKTVMPHLKLEKQDVINRQSQFSPSARKRKEENIKNFIASKKELYVDEPEPSATGYSAVRTQNTRYNSQNVWSSSGDFHVNRKTLATCAGVQVNLRRTVGVNTYIEKCHKAVQCNIINYN